MIGLSNASGCGSSGMRSCDSAPGHIVVPFRNRPRRSMIAHFQRSRSGPFMTSARRRRAEHRRLQIPSSEFFGRGRAQTRHLSLSNSIRGGVTGPFADQYPSPRLKTKLQNRVQGLARDQGQGDQTRRGLYACRKPPVQAVANNDWSRGASPSIPLPHRPQVTRNTRSVAMKSPHVVGTFSVMVRI